MDFFLKLDARVKFFFIFLLTLAVFFVDKLPAAACLLISFTVIRLVSRVPFNGVFFIKNLTLLAAIIIVTQMIFAPGESFIIKPLFPENFPILGGLGSLKWEGLILGVVIVLRLFALFILLPVFSQTTPPEKIASGLCSAGINYREAFIITTAFNLVFLFKEEALVIMNAQRLRGTRKFGIKAACALLVPLLLGAMKKARRSSVVMDCRAFGLYKTRTWTDNNALSGGEARGMDFVFCFFTIILFTGIILLNYFI
ncbi:MAG: energy-coupling factor transporter transmembrane protein EcfT [Treponema sp.]|nr:energy-coupling factor transporter transmembrane protein EcfT [Treponema sp.]